jgi:hypothetical protein
MAKWQTLRCKKKKNRVVDTRVATCQSQVGGSLKRYILDGAQQRRFDSCSDCNE